MKIKEIFVRKSFFIFFVIIGSMLNIALFLLYFKIFSSADFISFVASGITGIIFLAGFIDIYKKKNNIQAEKKKNLYFSAVLAFSFNFGSIFYMHSSVAKTMGAPVLKVIPLANGVVIGVFLLYAGFIHASNLGRKLILAMFIFASCRFFIHHSPYWQLTGFFVFLIICWLVSKRKLINNNRREVLG